MNLLNLHAFAGRRFRAKQYQGEAGAGTRSVAAKQRTNPTGGLDNLNNRAGYSVFGLVSFSHRFAARIAGICPNMSEFARCLQMFNEFISICLNLQEFPWICMFFLFDFHEFQAFTVMLLICMNFIEFT